MEDLTYLRDIFPDLSTKELEAMRQLRLRARTDHFYLANNILGYNFVLEVHKGLFDAMLQKDLSKPWNAQDSTKNRLILWPRGHFKTTAEAVEIIQLLLCFPDIRIMVMSGTLDLAKEIIKMAKAAFEENEAMKDLFPEYCGVNLGNVSEFNLPNRSGTAKRGMSVCIATESSTKAGKHCEIVFCDDLVHEKNYKNAEDLLAAQETYMHVSAAILEPGGYLYLIGTRYVYEDLYGWVLESVKDTMTVASEYKVTDGWTVHNHYGGEDKEWYITIRSCWKQYKAKDGTITYDILFPQRFTVGSKDRTKKNLLKIRRDQGEFFSCQYENSPLRSGVAYFSDDLIESHIVPWNRIPWNAPRVIMCDLATGSSERSDDRVIMVGIAAPDGLYIVDCISGQFDVYTLVENIVTTAFKHRVRRVFIEAPSGTRFIEPALTDYARRNNIGSLPLEFIPPRSHKDAKKLRILALQERFRSNRLYLFSGIPEEPLEKIKKQFKQYGATKHDDQVDAIALLVEVLPTVAFMSENHILNSITSQLETTRFDDGQPTYNSVYQELSTDNPPALPYFTSLGGLING